MWFLVCRGVATFASLGLALIYSRDLGQVNRSVMALIMSTNALLWIVFTSGATLTLRKIGWRELGPNLFNSFLSFTLVLITFVISIFSIVVLLYSHFKNTIPINLFIVSIFYVSLSGLHLIMNDLLISDTKFSTSAILDVGTIAFQYLFYLVINPTLHLSDANRLLVAYISSYAIIVFVGYSVLKRTKQYKVKLKSPIIFLSVSKYNHSLGSSVGLMDRADRMLIGFSLQTNILGKYAVTSSLISLLRFVPDSIAKLMVARQNLGKYRILQNRFLIVIASLVLGIATVGTSRFVVEKWLGVAWLIPLNVCLAVALQELIRGLYVLSANKSVSSGFSRNVNSISIMLPILAIVLSQIFLGKIGLIAVPLGFTFAYAIGFYRLSQNTHK